MHFFRNSSKPQQDQVPSDAARHSRNGSTSTTYVSTLDNALNIKTPASSKKTTVINTIYSTPTRSSHLTTRSENATPTNREDLRTPIRSVDISRVLAFSETESQKSPVPSSSLWSPAAICQTPSAGHQIDGNSQRSAPERDQEWLMSGPLSSRVVNLFEAPISTGSATTRMCSHSASNPDGTPSSGRTVDLESLLAGPSSAVSTFSSEVPRGTHSAFHDRSLGGFHLFTNETRAGLQASSSSSDISPSSSSSISPAQFSPALPRTLGPGSNDGSFLQDTPSVCTDPLPSNGLVDLLVPNVDVKATSTLHDALMLNLHDDITDSTASLSANTETSFASQSTSSTLDSSFTQPPSPLGEFASTFKNTPTSSMSFSFSRDLDSSKSSNLFSGPSDAQSSVATPEVIMQDFTEFGQSIPIHQMADPRWQTWPRVRDDVFLQDGASPLPPSRSPRLAPPHQTDERNSFDTTSPARSSSRSRHMAEPYNKGRRGSRPGSCGSLSSQSSFEGHESSGIVGPTRSKSLLGGKLRMTSMGRSVSQDVGRSDSALDSAHAYHRTRGLSQAKNPSASGNIPMKTTRSSDALLYSETLRDSLFAAVHRPAGSCDSTTQTLQRPQSLHELSSPSKSPGAANRSRARVSLNDVSNALDLLRLFVTQRESGEAPHPEEGYDNGSEATSSIDASPVKPGRILRRTKAAVSSRGTCASIDQATPPAPNTNGSRYPSEIAFMSTEQHHNHRTDRQDAKLAVIEDLSIRIRILKAEEERETAASMPPPTIVPDAVHLHTPSSSIMTRRRAREHHRQTRASASAPAHTNAFF